MWTKEYTRAYHVAYMKKWRKTEKGKKIRYERRKAYYAKTGHLSAGRRRKWTEDEIKILVNANCTDEELAYTLNRSVAGIQKKRWELRQNGIILGGRYV